MLHITYGSNEEFRVTTEEKRCDTSVASSQIRLLFKFTNDMDKRVVYAYGQSQVHFDAVRTYQRYTRVTILHTSAQNTEDVYTGLVNFKPYGYWKYEIYEVSWVGTVTLSLNNAPANEDETLEADDDIGVVQCLVETGKLYVTEKDGGEQIQYTEHPEPSGTNYIWTN